MSTAKKTYIGMSKYREVWQRLGRSAVVLGCLALLLVAALSAQQARAARPAQDGETKTQGTESLPADESLSRAEAYLRRQSRAVSDAKGAGSAGGMVTLPAAPRSSKGQASPQAVQCSPDWVTVESDNDREGSTTLKGVAVHSATDVWAVGSYVGYVGNVATVRTHIIHWDGQTWSRVPSPNQGNGYNLLEAVTAVSSNDAWAVGEYMDVATNKLRTLTLHWNGTAWALVTSPNAGPGFHLLLGVAQAGPDNVWAVGYYVNSSGVDRTFIMQWNGSSWGIATSANQGAEDNKLRGISVVPGSGGAVIWAVGVYEDASSHDHALFERYSSGSWSVVAGADLGAGSISDLSAVAAISATDIWATGTYSANSNFVPLSEHWNGSSWSKVSMPLPLGVKPLRTEVVSVSAVASNDVWAVGFHNANSDDTPLKWHWTGSSWNVSQYDDASTIHLAGVAAAGTGDVWAVGHDSAGYTGGLDVEHWNGSRWDTVAAPNGPTTSNYLDDISASSPNNIWAVGNYEVGDAAKQQTLVERWNGTAWTVVPSPNQGTKSNSLHGVAAVPGNDNDAWAVGGYIEGNEWRTLIMRWNGSTWGVVPSPSPGLSDVLMSVSVVSANDAWAVGHTLDNTGRFQTLILHWNGSIWAQIASPSGPGDNELLDVAVVPYTQGVDVWAVGYTLSSSNTQASLILRWDGSTSSWSIVPTPALPGPNNQLTAVSPHTHSDVWAVGSTTDGNEVAHTLTLHWDGQAWSHVDSPNQGAAGSSLHDTVALGTSDVWAVGSYYIGGVTTPGTLVQHWDGTSWTIVPSPSLIVSSSGLAAITAVSSTDLWSVGATIPVLATSYQTLAEHLNPCPISCSIEFVDVPQGSTYYPYVRCLACQGVLGGYADGFHPNDNVTRGQAAKIISNAAGYADAIPAATQTFVDVPHSSAFWLYVERVYKHDAISGYACGGAGEPCPGLYFRPGANLTRGQLAKITTSVAGYSETLSGQSFSDVPPASPFYQYIGRAKLHNVISGYACGGPGEPCPGSYFRPGNNVTRGQTAKIVAGTFFPDCPVAP